MLWKSRNIAILMIFLLVIQLFQPIGIVLATGLTAPKNLNLYVNNGNDITLRWDRESLATGYNIYQIIDGKREKVATTKTRSYSFFYMPEGEYIYEVTSYDSKNVESSNASRISHVLIHPEVKAPEALTLSVLNGNDLSLGWKESEFATKYNIYQVVDGQRNLLTTASGNTHLFANMPEGEYVFEVTAVSQRFGESIEAARVTQLLEHPEILPPDPLTFSVLNGNDINLTWSRVAFASKYDIYAISNGVREFVATTTANAHFLPNMPEGAYTFEVTAVSDRFGVSPAAVATYTLEHPMIASPEPLQVFVSNGSDLMLKWKKVEYAKEYLVYQVIDGTRQLVAKTAQDNYFLSYMPEGQHTFEVIGVSERFGESVQPAAATYDLVYPEIIAPEPLQANVVNGNDVNLTWKEVPYAIEYNIYEVIDGKRELIATTKQNQYILFYRPEGEQTFEVTASTERFGESGAASAQVSITFPEVEAPVLQLDSLIDRNAVISWNEVAIATSYNVYKMVNGELVLVDSARTPSYEISGIEDGEHDFVVTAVSARFGESVLSNSVTVHVQSDITAPVTTSNITDEWLTDDFTVQLTATDDKSGVDKTYYSISGAEFVEGTEFAVTEEGIHEVSFYSIDKAGNKEETKTVEVKIDKTAPETASNVTDGWLNQAFTVKLTATDDLSGVAKTYYSVNDAEFAEGTSFEVSEPGIHKVSFYSIDKAGNVEETEAVEVKIDKTAPETASNVTDDWLNQAFTVELTATDDLSGVAKTYYSVNDAESAEGTSFEVSEPGIHKVSFYSIDKAGNVEQTKTVEVKIDKTAPETASNVTDGWLNQAFTVELTATDDLSGVAKTYYSVNDAEFVEGSSFEVSEPGINKVSFYSVDNAGNVEETEAVEVKIDKTAPETASNVTDGWMTQDFTVELTAADDLSGVAKSYYSVNGGEYAEGTSFVVSEEGIHEVSFYSVDQAGNIEEAKAVEVKIDKTAPIVTWNIQKSAAGTDLTTSSCGRLGHWRAPFLHDNFEKKSCRKYIGSPWYLALSNQNPETTDLEVGDELELGTVLTIGYEAADNHSGIAIEELTVNGEKVAKGDQVTFDKTGEYNIQVTVKDNAGLQTTLEKTFMVYIPGNLKITPGTIRINKGVFTARVSLPKGFVPDFELSSVTLNGVAAKNKGKGSVHLASKGMFKFNREDFDWNKGEVLVEFRGTVNGQLVIARTTVTVK